jgi:hypothetical protein
MAERVIDPVFLPVGNTDEQQSMMGGASELYSPFSIAYSEPGISRTLRREAREVTGEKGTVQVNPPRYKEAEVDRILAYQAEEITDKGSTIPQTVNLAIAGFIVRRDWHTARELLRRSMAHIMRASKYLIKKGKDKGKPKVKTGQGTFYEVFAALVEWLDQIIARKKTPQRTVTNDKGNTYTVTLWDAVYGCCLASEGNVKLPFAAYSEMPIVTCPGAGGIKERFDVLAGPGLGRGKVSKKSGCGEWCYSLKDLRNPSKVARLHLLTLGFTLDPAKQCATVAQRMLDLQATTGTSILRLFVDGDFRDKNAVHHWMNTIKELGRSGVMVYGYSKSWKEMLQLDKEQGRGVWPSNYSLNLSSGSLHTDATEKQMRSLPISRGAFIAVKPIDQLVLAAYRAKFGDRGMDQARAALKRHYDALQPTIEAVFRRKQEGKQPTSGQKKTIDRAEADLVATVKALDVRVKRTRVNGTRKVEEVNLADAYDEYVHTAHELGKKQDSPIATYNAYAKKLTGKKDPVIALAPGQVVQAVTWKFVQMTQEKGRQWACPIQCGNCPRKMLAEHEKVVKRLMGQEVKELAKEMEVSLSKVEAESKKMIGAGVMHACGDMRIKADIIIGVH